MKIENLERLVNLQTLNLMRNEIKVMEGLTYLQNLKELNISKNKIERLEGLQFCQCLNTLKINSQRINQPMTFCPDSIIGISQSLRY